MCQTRCGESRLTATSKGVAVNKITSKYLIIGSTVIGAVEPFPYVCEFCCKIEQLREECRLLSKTVITLFSFFACLPVASKNASDMVDYLYDYENANVRNIPLMKSTERLGWIDDTSFFPYTAKNDICFETDFEDSNEIHKSLAEHGNFDTWLEYATKLRDNPYGRFMLASSFASVILEPLSHRVFFVNIWHDTTSGKSAACKMAVSVWGNPLKLMGSFNATAVGLERKADTLRNVIYGLDERQLANENRLPMAQIVYGLSNGFGRIRGSKEGGIQSMTNWRLIVLSTAEEPLLSDDSHDGMNTRVMEIHGVPIENKREGAEFHHVKLILINDGTKIKIARGVNSLTTTTETKGDDFKKIKIVEAVDMIRDDIRTTFEDDFVGKVENSYDNKIIFIAAINKYFTDLASSGVLYSQFENKAEIDIESTRVWLSQKKDVSAWDDEAIKTANTDTYVFVKANIQIQDAIEDLDFKIYMD